MFPAGMTAKGQEPGCKDKHDHKLICKLHLFFLLTWSQEVSQSAQKAPHAPIMVIFIQQFVKRAEELKNRLGVSNQIVRNQLLEKKIT